MDSRIKILQETIFIRRDAGNKVPADTPWLVVVVSEVPNEGAKILLDYFVILENITKADLVKVPDMIVKSEEPHFDRMAYYTLV